MDRKVLTIILTYNEEKCIVEVIKDAKINFPEGDILIVDGESTDGTVSRAKGMAVNVLTVPHSLGIAGGMEAGIMFADYHGYDFVVRIDGDGQHPAGEIKNLLPPVLKNEADLVIGSRFKQTSDDYTPTMVRSLGIRLFSQLLFLATGQRIYDTTSGFLVFNKRVIKYLSSLRNFEYSEVETILILNKAGFRILELPISMRKRQGGQSSFTAGLAFFYVFIGLMSIFLGLMRPLEKTGGKEL